MNDLFSYIIGKTYAADLIPCEDGTFADPIVGCVHTPSGIANSEGNLINLVLNIAEMLMSLVAISATIFIIYGAIQYIIASGDSERIGRAKMIILWSIFGLVVGVLAKSIVSFVLNTVI